MTLIDLPQPLSKNSETFTSRHQMYRISVIFMNSMFNSFSIRLRWSCVKGIDCSFPVFDSSLLVKMCIVSCVADLFQRCSRIQWCISPPLHNLYTLYITRQKCFPLSNLTVLVVARKALPVLALFYLFKQALGPKSTRNSAIICYITFKVR